MQPVGLQEWIHRIEEGEGTKYIRLAFFVLVLLAITAVWHLREAKNFAAPEAMDAAQVARNVSRGRGFTTENVHPFSIALMEKRGGTAASKILSEEHPDLANAPLYPTVLAGLMKVLPFNWEIPRTLFWRYQPETIIGGFNQVLFYVSLFLVFLIGQRLFDRTVAVLAVVLMALTEVYWEFATSGLATHLLMVLFLGLCWILLSFEEGAREATKSKGKLIGLAVGAGLLVGTMALTQYSWLWLIIPVAIYLAAVGTGVRAAVAPVAVVVAVLMVAPWLVRNYQWSGTLFGTAGFAIHQGTTVFPGHTLERSMPHNIALELNRLDLSEYPRKLFLNSQAVLSSELPEAAGSWIAAFFLGAMLMPFRGPALKRFKYFGAAALFVLCIVQALGRTELSVDTPRYNSENLLVVFSPLFFVLGAGFFFVLLDQIEFTNPWFRTVSIGLFVLVVSLPLVLRFLPPQTFPFNYPPYSPPTIQTVSRWLQPGELMMTDMPWATAWYGDRKSVWTTLDYGEKAADDFYRINDSHQAIMGLYLTELTTDAKFLSAMRHSREGVWGKFFLDALVLKNLPAGFPLKIGPPALLPNQMFLSDRIRWRQ